MENSLELLYITLGVFMIVTAYCLIDTLHCNVYQCQKEIVMYHQDYEILDRERDIYE